MSDDDLTSDELSNEAEVTDALSDLTETTGGTQRGSNDSPHAQPISSGVPSIFEAFEPPPEVDPNRFGPIPVIGIDDDSIDLDGATAIQRSDAEFGDEPEMSFDEIGPATAEVDVITPTELPHWTEPATGSVPRVIAAERADGEVWQELSGPRWKGEGPDWAGDDLAEVFGTSEPEDVVVIDGVDDDFSDLLPPAAGAPQRSTPTVGGRAAVGARRSDDEEPSGERNIPQAILVGTMMAAVALGAFRAPGNLWALGLITVVGVLASIELFDAMRRAGLHPATLLGITATLSFPLAVYARGDQAFPLMLGLTVIFGALWYIVGADTQRPALNLGLTFLGVSWIGGMAAFTALLLLIGDGKSIIVHAIVITVASDTGALAGGKAFGSRPFHRSSPNKTWEGTLVGFVSAVAAGVVMGVLEIGPFSGDLTHALYLGIVGGLLAPLGDLTESMIKRDLGVKDMGNLLPGHGGVLDRIDGLLFVLPGAYYLALVLGLA